MNRGIPPVVTFLSRPGCPLGDEARAELNGFLASTVGSGELDPGTTTEVVDIESDDELHRRFLERIPVIMVGDLIVSEFAFEPEALESVLKD